MPTRNGSNRVENEEQLDARCVVRFRPGINWKGEYGFDWFREGDYPEVFNNGLRGGSQFVAELNFTIFSYSHYYNEQLVGRYGAQINGYDCFDRNYNGLYKFVSRKLRNYTGQSLYYWRNTYFSGGIGIFVRENSTGQYHLEDLAGNVYDFTMQITSQTNAPKALFQLQVDNKGNPIVPYKMIQTNGLYQINVDQKRVYVWNSFTIDKMPIDPDWEEVLGLQPVLYQVDQNGDIKDASVFGRSLYTRLKIIGYGTETWYYVPTISLFYENKSVAQDNWGKSEATIKMLISGDYLDSNLNRLTLEFECTDGIKLSSKKIAGNNLTRIGDNYYNCDITIKLTKDFALFSRNGVDGTIKVYAKLSNGNRFLAGKLCVAKCIPKSVDIVFVPISVWNPIDGVIQEYPNVYEEKLNLKRFLNQAQIVPNIIDVRLSDVECGQIIRNHLETLFDNYGIPYQVGMSFNGLGRRLEELFNREYPNYANAYKAFLVGMTTNNGVLGMANGIPAKAAVIGPLAHINCDLSSVICHELCHCFGLYHSFTNVSPYTLHKHGTSNVMDYNYPDGLALLTFWKWQWDLLRNAQGMRDIEMDLHYGFFKRLKLWWHG